MSEKLKRDLRQVEGFTKIDLRGEGNIELTQGDKFELIIEAEPQLLDRITTELEGNTLVLAIEKGEMRFQTHEPIIYYITMPVVEGIRIAGSGKLEATSLNGQTFLLDLPGSATVNIGQLDITVLTINMPGSAKIRINGLKAEASTIHIQGSGNLEMPQFEAERLTVNIQGTGNICVQGTCSQQTISMPGVGNYQARMLKSQQATVHSPGLGNASLWVTDQLVVNMSGMGHIRYYGDAKLTSTVRGMVPAWMKSSITAASLPGEFP